MSIPKGLGINTNGLSKQTVSMLHESVEGAIEANRDNVYAFARAARRANASNFTGDIQRRGTNLPGDTGSNFGLHNQYSPFGFGFFGQNGFFGSRESYSGFFGPFGGLNNAYGLGGFAGVGGQGSLTGFKGSTKVAHYKMGSAVQAYKGFGIIRNVIDLMANFAAEGLKIKHGSKNVEKFYQRWAEHVDLAGRVKDILRYYYKYGNVFIYMTPGIIDEKTYDRMKRAKGKKNGPNKIEGFTKADSNDPNIKKRMDNVNKEKKKPLAEREIPWRYTLLNPFQMDLRGMKFFGESKWVFILDSTTANMIRNENLSSRKHIIDFLDESDINLPPEFKKLAGRDKEVKDPRVVNLDQSRLWTLHYMKDDHEDWADPMIWPVMNDLHFKNKMRQMDVSVCNSVINAITIFKLGDWKEGFVPPKEHFKKFAEFLRTPSAAMNMVWNDAVSIEASYPPVEKILSINKYESVDRDILRGLGVPDTLIGGAVNSNFSTGFLGVRTLLERLEEGRNTVIRWLNRQLRLIAATMGHRDIPTVRFGKMSLRDEKAEKQLILQLLDRNIISIQAVLEAFDEDFLIEIERLKEEEKIRDDTGLIQRHSPYIDPINEMDPEEQMKKESELRQQEQKLMMKMRDKERKNAKGPNGRPKNTDGVPQEKKRETKPRGMAWIKEYEKQRAYAIEHINKIEKVITETILESKGKKYKKSLSKKERQGIEDISFAVASNMDVLIPAKLEIIQENLRDYPRMHRRTAEIYSQLKEDGMSLEQRKFAMASAIATYEMEVD